MDTLAILPLKPLDSAKQRLSADLDPRARRALVEAMFTDVLIALRRATMVERVLVITADHVAQRIAAGYGADVLEDDEAGHSAAAQRGLERAGELAAERALLVPGDCPLLDPSELDALLAHPAPDRSVLVVPDRHDTGTNALVIRPPDAFEPAFGEGSHARHLERARAAGLAVETVPVGSLALDVDTAEDLATVETRLQDTRGGAALTRGMLRQLVRAHGA